MFPSLELIKQIKSLPKPVLDKILSTMFPQKDPNQVSLYLLTNEQIQTILCQCDIDYFWNYIDKFSIKIKEVPLEITNQWELGYQHTDFIPGKFPEDKMIYLKFFDFLMVDVDNIPLNTVKKLIDELNSSDNDLTTKQFQYKFCIYETTNGFHLFLVSKLLHYKDPRSLLIMRALFCDIHYMACSWKYGYKIRLTQKLKEKEFVMNKIGFYGDGEEDPKCLDLLKIHDSFFKKYIA